MIQYVKVNKAIFLSLLLLCALSMSGMLVTSYILRQTSLHLIGTCTGSDQFLHFHPAMNEAGSTLALRLGLPYARGLFIALCLVLSAGVALYAIYQTYLCRFYRVSTALCLPMGLLLGACLGRAVERVLWPYTLDFIAVRNLGIWDVGDVLLFLGALGLLAWALVQSFLERKATRGLNRAQRREYFRQRRQGFRTALVEGKLDIK